MKWIARSLSHVFEVHSRQLTLGEKQLAESVFGTHLQLDKIKIQGKATIVTGGNTNVQTQ